MRFRPKLLRTHATEVAALAAALTVTTTLILVSLHPRAPINPVPPELLNAAVTQDNIKNTICRPGYTQSIRPPTSYTNRLKLTQIASPAYLDKNPLDYEEDHWIALEVGGNPVNQSNLWPEPWPDARRKDQRENSLHRDVCSGKITLVQAQTDLYNWPR